MSNLQPISSEVPIVDSEMHPIVVSNLLPIPDGLAGHQHHPLALPILDGVGVAGVVEEGHAVVDSTTNWFHGESFITSV